MKPRFRQLVRDLKAEHARSPPAVPARKRPARGAARLAPLAEVGLVRRAGGVVALITALLLGARWRAKRVAWIRPKTKPA